MEQDRVPDLRGLEFSVGGRRDAKQRFFGVMSAIQSRDVEPADTEGQLYLPFYIRDLSIRGFWYPRGPGTNLSTDREGQL